jgi:cytochrome c oxidase subunit III
MESRDAILNLEVSTHNRLNPQKFSLWVAMASIIMFFAAFTSAYIVKQAAGNWLEFPIPNVFYFSTATIIVSSVVLHMAFRSFKIGQNQRIHQYGLIVTLVLGIIFIVLQYIGWNQLFELGVDFKANVSGSFFYLITGAHAAHVLGGITALMIANIHAQLLPFKPTSKRVNRFEMVVHYWHFMGVLWIYLLGFLIFMK